MFGRKAAVPGLEALDARARARLERFGLLFDGIPADGFHAYAGPVAEDGDLRDAMDAAVHELQNDGRRAAVKRAVGEFVEAARIRYSERFGFTEIIGLSARLGDRAADRVRVFRSLERAVVAVALWDRLADETRMRLAGPWGDLVETAAAEA